MSAGGHYPEPEQCDGKQRPSFQHVKTPHHKKLHDRKHQPRSVPENVVGEWKHPLDRMNEIRTDYQGDDHVRDCVGDQEQKRVPLRKEPTEEGNPVEISAQSSDPEKMSQASVQFGQTPGAGRG